MTVSYHEIQLETQGEVEIIDITEQVQSCISDSNINEGIACVFVPGSTGTLTTIEYEPGLQQDFPRFLEKIIPKDETYEHHKTWNDDNGHAHVRASLMGPSVTIPIHKKQLVHGTWQQLVFVELDTRPRNRTLIIQIIGE